MPIPYFGAILLDTPPDHPTNPDGSLADGTISEALIGMNKLQIQEALSRSHYLAEKFDEENGPPNDKNS